MNGDIYETIIVGAHADTGERFICLRRPKDHTTWFLELDKFREKHIDTAGKLVFRFKEITETYGNPDIPGPPPRIKENN